MFKTDDIIEFLSRIVKKTDEDNFENSKNTIASFKEYLELTTMCDEDILASISEVSDCLEELVSIYKKTGCCNVKFIFKKEDEEKKEKDFSLTRKRTFHTKTQEKHYERYIPTESHSTSSCGSSSSYGSSCGSSGWSGGFGSSC